MKKEDICFMSACEMKDAIIRQEITSEEITEIIIERIEKVNPIINAFCTTTFDLAREMAKEADKKVKNSENLGSLHGIPTSIKDLMETENVRTTFGCKIFENYIPKEDEIVVKRLKDAGMVLLGKTNTPAFGHLAVTDNLIFGATKNPWNEKKTSGGSSGGAAAAVASGMGPLALGSDGGGSIRIPSSFCGTYGLKPNYGRIPRISTRIGFYLLSHYGPIVRYVKDAALMLDVMSGSHDVDKYSIAKPKVSFIEALNEKPRKLKIGYSLDLGFIEYIQPEIVKSVLNAVQKFENLDWTVEKVGLKIENPEPPFRISILSGFAHDFKHYLKDWEEKMSRTLVYLIKEGLNYSGYEVNNAEFQRINYYNLIYQYFKDYDLLITPTMAVTPFELGKAGLSKIDGKEVNPLAWMPYTYLFNMTGHPAASIPCGWSSDGLPIGMQIVGKKCDETTVLQASKAFEEIEPWQDKRPKFTSI